MPVGDICPDTVPCFERFWKNTNNYFRWRGLQNYTRAELAANKRLPQQGCDQVENYLKLVEFTSVLNGTINVEVDVIDNSFTPLWGNDKNVKVTSEVYGYANDGSTLEFWACFPEDFDSEVDVIIPVNGVSPNREGMALRGALNMSLLRLRNFDASAVADNNDNELTSVVFPAIITGTITAIDNQTICQYNFALLEQFSGNAIRIENIGGSTALNIIPPSVNLADPFLDLEIGNPNTSIVSSTGVALDLDVRTFTNVTRRLRLQTSNTTTDILYTGNNNEIESIILVVGTGSTWGTGQDLDLKTDFPNAGGLLQVTNAAHDSITLPQGTGAYDDISLSTLTNITSLDFKNTGLNQNCDININRVPLTDFDLSNVFPDIGGMGLDVAFSTNNFVDGINIDCSSQVTFKVLFINLCNDINTLDLTNVVVNDAFALTRTIVTSVTFGTVLDPDVFTFANQTQYNGIFPLGDKIRSPEINIWGNSLNQANVDASLNNLLTNIANMPAGAKTLNIGNESEDTNASPSGLDASGNIPASPTAGTGADYIKQLGDNHDYTITYWDDVNLTDKTYPTP